MRFTMAAAALVLSTGVAFAQGTTPSTTNTAPSMAGTTTPGSTAGSVMPNSTVPGSQTPAATVNPNDRSTSSASPSAVQTNNTMKRTSAAPVPGRNSFTAGEARRRITSAGFSDVKDLKKDNQGIWRGMAMKDNATVKVSLDYQGNVVGQ